MFYSHKGVNMAFSIKIGAYYFSKTEIRKALKANAVSRSQFNKRVSNRETLALIDDAWRFV